ncbi:MAG TPA: NAD(P)-dependent oxidoreductase [Solirubrobacteraceae bacterium]
MATSERVAVLGAGGTMGFPMARNIARASIEVRAWNRSRQKAEPLAEDGVSVCDTPAEAADGAGIVITMLADTDAVIAAMEGDRGALATADESMIWLQMSTIGEAGTERCMTLARDHGVAFVDAPVLGTKQPAEQRQLVVLASGPVQTRDRVQPIFDAIGKKTIWVGEAGMGTRLKLVTNSWVLAVTEAAAEMIALAQGLGVDPALFFEAIEGGTLDLPYLRLKSKAILDHDFQPMFRLKLAAKDAALIEESATRRGLDLPLFGVIREQMGKAAEEHGDLDMSATFFASAPASRAA